jgi:hypothetical protein
MGKKNSPASMTRKKGSKSTSREDDNEQKAATAGSGTPGACAGYRLAAFASFAAFFSFGVFEGFFLVSFFASCAFAMAGELHVTG